MYLAAPDRALPSLPSDQGQHRAVYSSPKLPVAAWTEASGHREHVVLQEGVAPALPLPPSLLTATGLLIYQAGLRAGLRCEGEGLAMHRPLLPPVFGGSTVTPGWELGGKHPIQKGVTPPCTPQLGIKPAIRVHALTGN